MDFEELRREAKPHSKLSAKVTVIHRGDDLPYLACIPGGPGLSSKTLPFKNSLLNVNLLMVDPPGTAGQKRAKYSSSRHLAYCQVIMAISTAILRAATKLQVRGGRLGIFGHSYGGIMAVDCASQLIHQGIDIGSVIIAASPFTKSLFKKLKKNRKSKGSTELLEALNAYEAKRSDPYPIAQRAYNRLKQEYAVICGGSNPNVISIINDLFAKDKSCARATNALLPDLSPDYEMRWRTIPSVTVIAGTEDQLIEVNRAKEEARRLKRSLGLRLTFRTIAGAGHFPFIDDQRTFEREITSSLKRIKSASSSMR